MHIEKHNPMIFLLFIISVTLLETSALLLTLFNGNDSAAIFWYTAGFLIALSTPSLFQRKGYLSSYYSNFSLIKGLIYIILIIDISFFSFQQWQQMFNTLIQENTNIQTLFVVIGHIGTQIFITSLFYFLGYSTGKTLKLAIHDHLYSTHENTNNIGQIALLNTTIIILAVFVFLWPPALNLWLKLVMIELIILTVSKFYQPLGLRKALISGMIQTFIRLLFNRIVIAKKTLEEPHHDNKLIVCNHASLVDSLLMGSLFQEKMAFPIYTWWNEYWAVRNILGTAGHLHPVTPEDPKSLLSFIKTIRTGIAGVIFPEGRLSTTGNFMKFYEGASVTLDLSKAHLQCIALNGNYNLPFGFDDGRCVKKYKTPIYTNITKPFQPNPKSLKSEQRKSFFRQQIFMSLTQAYLNAYPKKSLTEALDLAMMRYGKSFYKNKKSLLTRDDWSKSIQYKTLKKRANTMAHHLINKHWHEQAVVLWLDLSIEMTELLFALFASDNIALPQQRNKSPEQTWALMKEKQIKKIIILEKDAHLWKQLEQEGLEVVHYEQLLKPALIFKQYKCKNPSTTGALMWLEDKNNHIHTHTNLCQQIYQIGLYWHLNGFDIVFSNGEKLDHFMLICGLLAPIFHGIATFIAHKKQNTTSFLSKVYQSQATTIISHKENIEQHQDIIANIYEAWTVKTLISETKVNTKTQRSWQENSHCVFFSTLQEKTTQAFIAMQTPYLINKESFGLRLPGTIFYAQDQNLDQEQPNSITDALPDANSIEIIENIKGPQIPDMIWNISDQQAAFKKTLTVKTIKQNLCENHEGLLFQAYKKSQTNKENEEK